MGNKKEFTVKSPKDIKINGKTPATLAKKAKLLDKGLRLNDVLKNFKGLKHG